MWLEDGRRNAIPTAMLAIILAGSDKIQFHKPSDCRQILQPLQLWTPNQPICKAWTNIQLRFSIDPHKLFRSHVFNRRMPLFAVAKHPERTGRGGRDRHGFR